MPAVTLAVTDSNRKYGRIPHYRLKNGFIEEDKANGVNGTVWLQRPGLAEPFSLGSGGAVRMVWVQVGTFNDDWLVISGTTLYRIPQVGGLSSHGTIATSDYPVIAGGRQVAVIVSEGIAYRFNGATLTAIAIPDGKKVSSVAYINDYFILPISGSREFYWIAPGATEPDPLDFASCERKADDIINVSVQGDTIIFQKETNEEYWYPTGSPDAPFQRASGRTSEFGCVSRNTSALCGPAIVWMTSDFQVVACEGAPQVISSPSMTEALRQSANYRAWSYMLDGHPFYILTTRDQTFVIDLSTGSAAEYNSHGYDMWRAHLGAQVHGAAYQGPGVLVGDMNSGTVWKLDPEASNDDGETVSREVVGYIENVGQPVSCDSLTLCVDAGWSPEPGFEPQLQVRFSDDQGATWSSWKTKSLGDQGHYSKDITWRSLGLIVRPGRLFHFRMTDDARFRLSYARVNEV